MKKIRFMHIPKTAGTTFRNILKHQYPGKEHFNFDGEITSDTKRFLMLPDSERRAFPLISGHAPIKTGIREIDNMPIITLLRDPISRVKSYCQHVSEGKIPYLSKKFPSDSFDLDAFLKSGNLELSNMQSKMLINERHCCCELHLSKMSALEARDEALEALLEKVLCFGLQEYFDESLMLFKDRLNWSWPFYIHTNKKNPNKLIEFKKHHIEQIIELNKVDIEVYAAAKKKFLNIINSKQFNKNRLKKFIIFMAIRRLPKRCTRAIAHPLRIAKLSGQAIKTMK